jgi:hypothetical protein
MNLRTIAALSLSTSALLSTAVSHAQDAGVAAAPTAPALALDDGTLWFEAESVEDTVAGARVDRGYYLKSWVRVWGRLPADSAVVFTYSQNGRQLARVRCTVDIPGFDRDPAFAHVRIGNCYDRAALITVTGDVQVEIKAVNGATDAETVLATRTVNVQRVAQVGGGVPPRARPDNYYVSHHGRIMDSVLFWQSYNHNDEFAWSYVDHGIGGSLVGMLVAFNANDTISDPVIADFSVRCQVNGQPFTTEGSPIPANTSNVRSTRLHRSYLPPGSTGGTAIQVMRYVHMQVQMPFRSTHLRDHPGRWTCDLRSNGKNVRRWAWTVAANGALEPHAEQRAGLNLGPRAILVETTIPADGGLDERTNPAEVRAGGFYGRPWTSDIARTQAAAVPAIGQPYLPHEPYRPGRPAAAASGARAGRRRR